MIHLPASVRVYLCLSACDMRKSFDGLHALVREYLELDPFAGHLVVFASRRSHRARDLDKRAKHSWASSAEQAELLSRHLTDDRRQFPGAELIASNA